MCRLPVTFGGGMTIETASASGSSLISAQKTALFPAFVMILFGFFGIVGFGNFHIVKRAILKQKRLAFILPTKTNRGSYKAFAGEFNNFSASFSTTFLNDQIDQFGRKRDNRSNFLLLRRPALQCRNYMSARHGTVGSSSRSESSNARLTPFWSGGRFGSAVVRSQS